MSAVAFGIGGAQAALVKVLLSIMSDKSIFAILHNIRSAHNIGSIFRTADGAGVSRVYLTGNTPIPYTVEKWKTRPHRDIEKTALGAEKYIPWEYEKRAGLLIGKLKKEGSEIVALEQTKKGIPYYKFKPKFPLCLIAGNEVSGLPRSILKQADAIIEIPMLGKKESLNVAVAFGIAIYALRQK